MSVLVGNTQKLVEEDLVSRSVIDRGLLVSLRKKSETTGEPFIGLLITEGHVPEEDLTKSIATVTKVPYVDLSDARVNPKTLSLLPQEVAERYMAVPLGEMQNRLVVGMLDADNVQAVDFLSNKIGRPLKVYLASENGIRHVLRQYQTDLDKEVVDVLARPRPLARGAAQEPNASNMGESRQHWPPAVGAHRPKCLLHVRPSCSRVVKRDQAASG
jgi:type IV pilus assembly protein PilB